LVKIYENIGFHIQSGDMERKNVVMASTVSNLIEVLRSKCGTGTVGGKKRKRRTRKNAKKGKKSRRTKRIRNKKLN